MKNDTWVKLHTSLLISEKFRFLPTNDHRLTFILLILLQKKGLISQPDEFISAMVFVSKAKLVKIKNDLEDMGLLDADGLVTNNEEMQLSPATLRKRNQRERDKERDMSRDKSRSCPVTNTRDSRKQRAEEDKKGGGIVPMVGTTTKGKPPEKPDKESPPIIENQILREPTPKQLALLEDMARERGRQLRTEAQSAGLSWPLQRSEVTACKRHLEALEQLTAADLEKKAAQVARDCLWAELQPSLPDPELMAARILEHHEKSDREAWGLLMRLSGWLGDKAEANDLPRPSLMWEDLVRLPEVYDRAGVTLEVVGHAFAN